MIFFAQCRFPNSGKKFRGSATLEWGMAATRCASLINAIDDRINPTVDTLSARRAHERPDLLQVMWALALRFEGAVVGEQQWPITTG